MLEDFIVYILVGAFAGLASGTLGVGGGIVVVPALAFIFKREHFASPTIMHIAVATSLAAMILTTLMALRGHLRLKEPCWPIYKRFFVSIIVGLVFGAGLAHYLHSKTLSLLFGVVVIVFGINMLLPKMKVGHRKMPGLFGCSVVGSFLGVFSGLLGIGAGSIMVPSLGYMGVKIRQAVLVSCAFGMTVGIVGSLSFMVTGMDAADLPDWSTGYVYWPAVVGVNIGGVIFAPMGVKLSHYLPQKILTRIFSVFLMVIGLHMLSLAMGL